MNTVQIIYALKHDNITNKQFVGVLPSDRLSKKITHSPCCFVANMDPSPGTHWVAFHVAEGQAEFFDSYGRSPENYNDWVMRETLISSIQCNSVLLTYGTLCMLSTMDQKSKDIVTCRNSLFSSLYSAPNLFVFSSQGL